MSFGTLEVAVPAYQAFASSELLDELALELMLAKLSPTRCWPRPSSKGSPGPWSALILARLHLCGRAG
jgi:hypothetical protein